jgi:hypothetical protein
MGALFGKNILNFVISDVCEVPFETKISGFIRIRYEGVVCPGILQGHFAELQWILEPGGWVNH